MSVSFDANRPEAEAAAPPLSGVGPRLASRAAEVQTTELEALRTLQHARAALAALADAGVLLGARSRSPAGCRYRPLRTRRARRRCRR